MPAILDESRNSEESYRSLSALAVISLLFGFASPLAFVTPLLRVIPFFGIAIAVLSLVRIAHSDGLMIGRRAALLGLALCVVSLSAVSSRSILTRRFLSYQAQEAALQWFTLLGKGQLEQAFERTVKAARPVPPPGPSASASNGESIDPLKRFLKDHFIIALHEIGDEVKVRFDKDLYVQKGSYGQYLIRQQYTITYLNEEGGTKTIKVQLLLIRSRKSANDRLQWFIDQYQIVNHPAMEL